MCARQNISYRYALEWMGHSNSEILSLYYTMYDSTAEIAIKTISYPVPQRSRGNRSSDLSDSRAKSRRTRHGKKVRLPPNRQRPGEGAGTVPAPRGGRVAALPR